MKETGRRQTGGSVSQSAASISGLSRKSPLPSGISLSLISTSHTGCTQSPVPTTRTPLRAAHQNRCSRSRSRLVAREYFEWICRSAWKIMVRRRVSRVGAGARPPTRHPLDNRREKNRHERAKQMPPCRTGASSGDPDVTCMKYGRRHPVCQSEQSRLTARASSAPTGPLVIIGQFHSSGERLSPPEDGARSAADNGRSAARTALALAGGLQRNRNPE